MYIQIHVVDKSVQTNTILPLTQLQSKSSSSKHTIPYYYIQTHDNKAFILSHIVQIFNRSSSCST